MTTIYTFTKVIIHWKPSTTYAKRFISLTKRKGAMKREIKFRVWTGKRMFYQDDQYLGSFLRRACMHITHDEGHDEKEHESYLDFDIDHYLMQYTGLKDAKGNDIYEGDILSNAALDGEYYQVIFDDGCFYTSWGGVQEQLSECLYMEIMGNIHENPELIPNRPGA